MMVARGEARAPARRAPPRLMATILSRRRARGTAADRALVALSRKINQHRVAHLATASKQGRPLVVPLCFVCQGTTVFSVVDEKPKRVAAERLRRLQNIRENPQVALLVDHYEEDWTRLSYLLGEGRARILRSGREHAAALRRLRRKYPQYRRMRLEDKPVIRIALQKVTHWRPGTV
ncbi:MAG TPA: TIGR03668 family PPOX class F420-dependent oxidoreductase [Terriglobia bacterium]|nr:TIGR03668 family PPOX class F420-dependent oxidoreductase [Terriglobia bacterium]